MSTINIEKIRAEKVRDFYLIHRDGFTLCHRAYVRSKVDDTLLSGFLTAIFAISKELSIKKIQVMDLDDVKFIYENFPPYLLILCVNEDISLEFGKSILSEAMDYFEVILDSLEDHIKTDLNELAQYLKSINFKSNLDKFVNKAIMDEYFKNPLKIIETIESHLVNLFGSMGKEIVENSIRKICRIKSNFKNENIEQLVSLIEQSLGKKMNPFQVTLITKQIRETFSI